MTITQALKEKNKLVKEIEVAYQQAFQNNSIEEGNTRKYSVEAKLKEAGELTTKLVELKTKIHKANLSVYDKIFLMAELKGRVNKIKSLSTDEGKISQDRWSGGVSILKTVEIDVIKKDQMVKDLEKQIEDIQNELDVHNNTTTI